MGGATVQQRKPRKPGERRVMARWELFFFFVWPPGEGERKRGSAGKFQEKPVGVKMTLHCAVPCYLWKTNKHLLLLPDEMRTLVSEGLFLFIGATRRVLRSAIRRSLFCLVN
jgi:hypothetical protein